MHIVSFSGGKDSTAMLIGMLEKEMQVDRIIFADTKYEFPEMHEYIKEVDQYIKRYGDYKIETVITEDSLEKWMFGKITRGESEGEVRGFPLTAYPCYWSRESKFKVLDKEMRGHDRYIGIAIDESNRKQDIEGYHYPLIEWGWTEDYCIDYLKKKGLHNPLYDRFDRLGCWWCPKQSMKSLKALYKYYPELWQQLLDMEDRLLEVKPDSRFKPDSTVRELEPRIKREILLEDNQLSLLEG